MAIVKNGLVVEDIWRPLGGREPVSLDTATPLLVSPSDLAERSNAFTRFSRLGLVLAPADDARDIAGFLDRLELVVVTFPKFNDGRAFSQARLLRDAHGFTGEIRAGGHILLDQFSFLRRSGVDAIEVPHDSLAEAWATAWDAEAMRFKGNYQPAFGLNTNRTPPGEVSTGLRCSAKSTTVRDVSVGVPPAHDPSWAGAWGY